MERNEKSITIQCMDKILRFLPIFEQQNYKFAEWVSPTKSNNTTKYLPYCYYSKEVIEFEKTLYKEGFIIPFDWSNWQKEAERLYSEPATLRKAGFETLRKLLTTHIRKERFCEGHLAGMLEEGHISAILHRLKEVREDMASSKQQ